MENKGGIGVRAAYPPPLFDDTSIGGRLYPQDCVVSCFILSRIEDLLLLTIRAARKKTTANAAKNQDAVCNKNLPTSDTGEAEPPMLTKILMTHPTKKLLKA